MRKFLASSVLMLSLAVPSFAKLHKGVLSVASYPVRHPKQSYHASKKVASASVKVAKAPVKAGKYAGKHVVKPVAKGAKKVLIG